MKRTGSIGSRVPPARDDDVPAGEVGARAAARPAGGRAAGSARTDRSIADGRDDGVDDRRQLGQAADARLARRERARRRLDDRVAEVVAQPRDVGAASPDASTCRRPSPARRRPARAVARQVAVTTSPARPLAIAPSQCAVAGATTIASAVSATTMCPIRPSGSSSSSVGLDRVARQRRERQRPDERASPTGVSIADDVGALGAQQPEQLDRLVGGDRAGDAEPDQPALEPAASRQPELEPLAAGDLGVEDREALERQVGVDRVDALEAACPRRRRQPAGQDRADVGRGARRSGRRARAGSARAARRRAPGSRRPCPTASR